MSVTMQTGFTSGNINAVSQQGNNNNLVLPKVIK
jgi:hypothetical protein